MLPSEPDPVNEGSHAPDVAAELRRAWKRAYPGAKPPNGYDVDQLPRVLMELPGWPFPPTDGRAGDLAAAVAGMLVRAVGDAWMARAAVKHLGDAWGRLLDDAGREAAIDRYRTFRTPGGYEGEDKDIYAPVPGLVRSGEPLVIGGPEKSAKTLLSIELAAAIATGTSFLGLPVKEPGSVWALTLETSRDLWTERFYQAVEARGCDASEARGRLTVTNKLADLRSKKGRAELREFLPLARLTIAIIDPEYLTLRDRSNDLAAGGQELRRLVAPFVTEDVTPVLVHHFTKAVRPGDLPTLRDLSGSATGPFARSWLLVNRRAEFKGGAHQLLALVGTGAGDCRSLRVRFDELKWKVSATPHDDAGTGPNCTTDEAASDSEPVAEYVPRKRGKRQ